MGSRMASEEYYAMKGGDGSQSYAKNSSFQKGATDSAKEIIEEEIEQKLDIEKLSTNVIRVADFGCSTGPNTFYAVQTIVEAMSKKIVSPHIMPEFQVFFNDRISNDFNTLFASLPPERQYYAAGVPGSFRRRLLPKDSLHFAYSACSLHWLSELPKEVLDPSSPAWNKGKIMYYGEKNNQVFKAYAAQFAKDLDSFLKARAQELVPGALMAILIASEPDYTKTTAPIISFPSLELLGSCLVDLAKEGWFDMAKVDSFNKPTYFVSPGELRDLIARNEDFSIERMEILHHPPKHLTCPDAKSFAVFVRSFSEGLLQIHFGSEIMDELFKRYEEKVEESQVLSNPNESSMTTFVLLKCVKIIN